jgi:hypothetical protein
MVDYNVYSEATANEMLQDKKYARVRGIKLVHEAIYRLLFQSINSWLIAQIETFPQNWLTRKYITFKMSYQ